MNQEYLRGLVFAFACCGSFLAIGALLYRLEAGFYRPGEMPIPVLDGPHMRARRSLYRSAALVLLVVSLLGLASYEMMPEAFWANVGLPALAGVYFSMLATCGFCGDQVRPRLS